MAARTGVPRQEPRAFAEAVPGESTQHFCNLAKDLGVYITVPLIERAEATVEGAAAESPVGGVSDASVGGVSGPTVGGVSDADSTSPQDQSEPAQTRAEPESTRYFNTVCLAAPTGQLVAHYRKLTPWPHPEKSWATPGDRGVQTYDTEYGRVGLAICFDIHTILEKYEPHHIWALLYPIAWVDDDHPAEWFWHGLPERIAPFHHYVIGANWSVDQAQRWHGYGFSTIYAPDGKVLASAKSLHGSEIVYATIPTQWAK